MSVPEGRVCVCKVQYTPDWTSRSVAGALVELLLGALPAQPLHTIGSESRGAGLRGVGTRSTEPPQ